MARVAYVPGLYNFAPRHCRLRQGEEVIHVVLGNESIYRRGAWLLPVVVFLGLVLLHSELPGIYMDGVNPDFMAAQWLHRSHNPGAGIPYKLLPILGSFYHGLQNAYLGVPFFAIAGFSVTSLRLEQAIFGVILLVALYHLTRRLAGSQGWALLASTGLATELAFTASFRTQFYIVLGGAAWLFVSMLLALPADAESRVLKRRAFWSGVCFGLSSYGYFVLAFFTPAMALYVATVTPRKQWRAWIVGAAVGVSPFLLGFISLLAKKHGLEPTLEFVRSMLGQLKPFEAGGASGNNLSHAWELTRLAISDSGNEAMIFGQFLPGTWESLKALWLAISIATLITWGLRCCLRREIVAAAPAVLALMPISFIGVASFFGHRLWAHHFSVIVPFVYLLAALALSIIARMLGLSSKATRIGVAALLFLTLCGNLFQQTRFHDELVATGGRGRSTDALTRLALEARKAPADVGYLFPEWGFDMSFCFLTENRIRYGVDLSPKTLTKLKRDGVRELRLVYWDPANEGSYRDVLRENGVKAPESRDFFGREGQPVFYWLAGKVEDIPATP